MKKYFILIVIISLLLLSVAWGMIDALAGVKAMPQPDVTVISVIGEAELLRSGSVEWIDIKSGMEINEGDRIKTGDKALVAINFYDSTTARIDENCDIDIKDLSVDSGNFAKIKIGINIKVGRVWSRILQLADRDAVYEVESSNTVATVRGTAFDFQVQKDGLAKIQAEEGMVDVGLAKKEEKQDMSTTTAISNIRIIEGEKVGIPPQYEGDIQGLKIEKVQGDEADKNWIENNLQKDKDFEATVVEKLIRINSDISGVLPGENGYAAKIFSEQILIFLAKGEKEDKVAAWYITRRLAEAIEMLRKDNIDEALRLFEKFNEEFVKFNNSKIININTPLFQEVMAIFYNQYNLDSFLIERLDLGADRERIIDKWGQIGDSLFHEDKVNWYLVYRQAIDNSKEAYNWAMIGRGDAYSKYHDIFSSKAGQLKDAGELGLYKRAMDYDDMLRSRLERLKNMRNVDDAKIGASEAFEGEKPISGTSTQPARKTNSSLEKSVDDGQIRLLDVPVDSVQKIEDLKDPVQPSSPSENIDSTASSASDSQPSPTAGSSAQPSQPSPATTTKTLVELKVTTVGGTSMLANSTKQLVATASYSDGSTEDVTKLSAWALRGDIGKISPDGVIYSDADGGDGVATAVYVYEGISKTGNSPTITALTIGIK